MTKKGSLFLGWWLLEDKLSIILTLGWPGWICSIADWHTNGLPGLHLAFAFGRCNALSMHNLASFIHLYCWSCADFSLTVHLAGDTPRCWWSHCPGFDAATLLILQMNVQDLMLPLYCPDCARTFVMYSYCCRVFWSYCPGFYAACSVGSWILFVA